MGRSWVRARPVRDGGRDEREGSAGVGRAGKVGRVGSGVDATAVSMGVWVRRWEGPECTSGFRVWAWAASALGPAPPHRGDRRRDPECSTSVIVVSGLGTAGARSTSMVPSGDPELPRLAMGAGEASGPGAEVVVADVNEGEGSGSGGGNAAMAAEGT